jgi:hypothetical protein
VTWLRAAGLAIGAVVVLWLVALVAGVLGFGNVTGLSLPGLDGPKSAVLHPTAGQTTAAGIRRTSSTAISLRSGSTPSTVRGRPQIAARGSAGGQAGPGAARRPATTRPSTAAPTTTSGSVATPSAGTVHGKHLGNGGSGTSSPSTSNPSTSNPHRTTAPGQQKTVPAASTPTSPNARRNRQTTTG